MQRLHSLERNMGTLLEKMEILDKVDRALQRMGESEHPSLNQGKMAAGDTMIQQPQSHALDSSGISGLGEELGATLNEKNSSAT